MGGRAPLLQRVGRLQVHPWRRGAARARRRLPPALAGVAEGCFSNDAEKLAGRLLAELQFSTAAEIFDIGLHTYIDNLQSKLNDIGAALFQAYIFQPFLAPDIEELHQQEEQQQQAVPAVSQ